MNGTKAWLIGLGWLGAYEAWAIATGHQTLSEAVWSIECIDPLVVFAAGVISGHLFFQTIKAGRPS
jgi:hypothetical protein